ncbi:MAG: bifunctional (p)ppGpp synthetase/guanosine-3',5'-bis(diphosphate) 3'-pyrophosphohydrolase [Eubacteriales bacterium]|nr:bifunctional (p)ppGpp synthetase/guanosine-3',5'-bis(diphosphate) 3'-pyrophosphohydrolase [Eubacteriales bacterium]
MQDELIKNTLKEDLEKAGIDTDIGSSDTEGSLDKEKIKAVSNGLEEIGDGKTPEQLYADLMGMIAINYPNMETDMIEKAYLYAKEHHKDQKRRSGEPYIIHPLCVAIILAGMDMDRDTIVAALLHDVVEDTGVTLEEVEAEFSKDVARLVDGVTKLTNLNYDMSKLEIQAENLRKMFVAMAKDIRVIVIKLADRLHNLRTLQYQKREKQIEKATETLDIYSPIADRLGISKMKVELDDLSLKYLEPEVYYDLVEKISLKREERDAVISGIVREVKSHLVDAGIKATVVGRVKHFFSIYKKMKKQEKNLDQIYDLFAVRILVDNVKDCYGALGVIHEMYKPIPGRFKDYIAMPKPNMYQSLHTTLIGKDGTPFEIQIRTFDMHRIAEYGIAAHWNYKEKGSTKANEAETQKMNWLRQVLELNQETESNTEFMNLVKEDLNIMGDEVFCFTPKGEVKQLPAGSTPIDFAYMVHTAVGNKMVGAKVNGKLVPLTYEIQNGDQVDIVTSQNSKGPSMDWLNIVKSTQAKNKIQAWFKSENKENNINRGRDALTTYCKAKNINFPELNKPEYQEAVLRRYALKDWDGILAAIGHGALKESQVINKLSEAKRKDDVANMTDEDVLLKAQEEYNDKPVRKNKNGGITIHGIRDVAVKYAHCCNPVPGDEIVGFVTRGRGITVHRTDCINMINLPNDEKSRMIEATWQENSESGHDTYSAEIRIYCSPRLGMVVDISRVFTEEQIDITSINLKNAKNGTGTLTATFDIHGKDELKKLIEKLRAIPGVLDIERTAG